MASNAEDDRLLEWCNKELSQLLKTPSEEITRYILSIQIEPDLETFLNEVLVSVPDHERHQFIDNLKSRMHFDRTYRKPDIIDGNSDAFQKRNVSKKKNKQSCETDSSPAVVKKEETRQQGSSGKKKPHYVSIYSKEGKERGIMRLPGRNPCNCLASKHGLINNCLSCGRIVCKQEGSGPCFTCNQWVCTPEESLARKKMTNEEREASELEAEELMKAREQRDRLLEYSANSDERTRVIDDQTDYYSSQSTKWMSREEKELARKRDELREQRKADAKQTRKFTLDFAGRKVIECQEEEPEENYLSFQDIFPKSSLQNVQRNEVSNVAPNLAQEKPIYVEDCSVTANEGHNRYKIEKETEHLRNLRLQDRELQEMADDGMCLSLHQPYASLLISGIKVHEGRSWYTAFRGCLWIHAAKKEPTKAEIKEVEFSCSVINSDKALVFPQHYPTSCLLGCVTLVDCLPQEEYRIQYPDGESGSPYVFLCENPQELVLKMPMSGKHKIFKMDTNIHHAAKKILRKRTGLQ